jgi:hypothetical protein
MTKKEAEKDEEKKEGEDREVAIDFGIVTLGGIFNLVNKIIEAGVNLKELESKLQEIKDEGKLRTKADIRVSLLGEEKQIRIGSGTFLKQLDELTRERSPAPLPSREPVLSSKDLVKTELTADVIEHEDAVYVLTQVPYNEDEIKINFRRCGDTGDLSIEAPKHGYDRLIPINVRVDVPDGGKVQWSYKNHVVEAVLPKQKTSEG